jgi:hypothetical protein
LEGSVDFEEYRRRIRLINQRVDLISERTAAMARAGAAHVANPEFIEWMTEFESLVERSERLTNDMQEQVNKK